MLDANVKIISELKNFLAMVSENEALLDQFRTKKAYFTRKRKLPFPKLALFIVKLCKKTLSVELEQFFEEMNGSDECSTSALTQQRVKLDPLFFYYWNMVLYKSYYYYYGPSVKRWKGYRIIAADGSTVTLIANKALEKHFGGQGNQSSRSVLAKTLYHYDVLNEMISFSQIKPYRYGELNMAYDAIVNAEDDMLMIYDRNFCNYKMVALHVFNEVERKFVIRAKESQNIVRDFIKSGKDSEIVSLAPSSKSIKALKKSGFIINKDTLLPVRLVRVELENPDSKKVIEVLMTNLWEEEGHHINEFKGLYSMRWGVEVSILIQKNIIQLESFSGQTPESVEQDFYATAMMANLHSLLIKPAQKIVDENTKHMKYPMKVNKSRSFGRLKISLVSLFLKNDVTTILEKLNTYFIKYPQPVRDGRSYKRYRRNSPSKSKHRTYTNYKPAY